jgi:hypothetical protein
MSDMTIDDVITFIEREIPPKCWSCGWGLSCLKYPRLRIACEQWGPGAVPDIPRCSTCYDSRCEHVGKVRPAPGDGACWRGGR